MAAYMVVDEISNLVVNAIEWDGVATFTPPTGTILVQSDTAGIGFTYDPIEETFTPPA